MNATLPRPAIKSAVVLFAPSMVARLRNPAFGRMPQRGPRLPVGPSAADAAWAAANLNDASAAPTEAESFDRMAALTMSAAEYRAFRAGALAAELDRYAACEPAELAEFGITSARMDELARESAELDAVCGLGFATAVESPIPARGPGRKAETLHTRHRAARLARASV